MAVARSLSLQEIHNQLETLPGWIITNNPQLALSKTFVFKDFLDAIKFINIIAWHAQNKHAHHPDITINYNKVTFQLSTHDAQAITHNDIELAQKIEKKAHESLSNDLATTVAQLRDEVEQFTTERDWTQYHSLKNVATNLIGEAAELLEHFTWLDREDEKNLESKRTEIEDEVVDVLFSTLLFANRFNTNLVEAFERKMEQNAKKYPVDKAKGKKDKYTTYQ